MADIKIRRKGCAGRITLTRPKALNALSYDMCLAIEAALDAWRNDARVALVVIDGAGDRAFCAGGDIQEMYDTGTRGDYRYGRRFWADEYRLNAKIARYPKPYVAFMQGFTMGGGVGISCHGSQRIVGDSSQIAMPECGIGLVPDVGGSFLLSRAPGHLGEYLGLTATRMGAADAIYAGFADCYMPELMWPEVIASLEATGDINVITKSERPAPAGQLPGLQASIDACFGGATLQDILTMLHEGNSDFARGALKALSRNSPLSMAVTVEMLHRLRRQNGDICTSLDMEYRYTYRAMAHGDFLEGIRAAIIDKDRSPRWQHDIAARIRPETVAEMLAPLGDNALTLKEK